MNAENPKEINPFQKCTKKSKQEQELKKKTKLLKEEVEEMVKSNEKLEEFLKAKEEEWSRKKESWRMTPTLEKKRLAKSKRTGRKKAL